MPEMTMVQTNLTRSWTPLSLESSPTGVKIQLRTEGPVLVTVAQGLPRPTSIEGFILSADNRELDLPDLGNGAGNVFFRSPNGDESDLLAVYSYGDSGPVIAQ